MTTMTRGGIVAAAALTGAIAIRRRSRSGGLPTADLSGKTAVITGAGAGIGRSLAVLLSERGATVHVVDRDRAGAELTAAQIRTAGGNAVPHQVDVADGGAVADLADTVFRAGPVDLLFNNAGVGHAGALADTSLEDWRRLVEVNLMGVVHGLHAFLPRLLTQGGPVQIVNTASMAGLVPNPGLTAYTATKSAVVGLSQALDMELTGSGIRVTAICPGIIDTGIVAASTMTGPAAEGRARMVDFYSRRGTSPDVVARQTLAAVQHGRRIVATPRYQVLPHWWLQRMAPPAGRAVSMATYRFMSKK